MPLDFSGLPYFVGRLIATTMQNEKCTPDAVLLIADALEECAAHLPNQTIYRTPCNRVAQQLRDRAAEFANGRPHDFPE